MARPTDETVNITVRETDADGKFLRKKVHTDTLVPLSGPMVNTALAVWGEAGAPKNASISISSSKGGYYSFKVRNGELTDGS